MAVQIQTESPYFLPAPLAPAPFTAALGIFNADPTFLDCLPSNPGCAAAWALRIVDSANIHIAGAGLYNWFKAYTQQCVDSQNCQNKLVSTMQSGGSKSQLLLNILISPSLLKIFTLDLEFERGS
jgi:hypothetical protein